MKKKEERRIGDNSQFPIAESAINFIRNIRDSLIVQKKYCEKSFNGENETIRDINAMNSVAQINAILNKLNPWNEIIKAKDNGVIVHSAPIKTHKLDIVADRHHEFGQYIVDKPIIRDEDKPVIHDEYGDAISEEEFYAGMAKAANEEK